ncbi:encapsulin-associated ferritin-like protein [Saccharicrinis sp. FJH54]|uniref:encapsulin-associated ferritin-like protein n=1 Tax=Saccharicrinis sp. FJH54 TaxID=3344665 RepID=UPI0035D4BD2F
MQNYHEPPSELSIQTRDFTRALTTLKEEVEAIDWYEQRVDAAEDQHLKKILRHNQLEEMEHACMTLEWLRRNMKGWDKQMRQYLFTEKDIVKIEDE